MTRRKCFALAITGALTLTTPAVTLDAIQDATDSGDSVRDAHSRATHGVHALFDVGRPDIGPFPSDAFTVRDPAHNTRRHVNLPYPDCSMQPSDCQDIDVINTLDGFNLQPRLSIAFDGAIDPSTVTSETVFLINLGSTVHPEDEQVGRLVGINQVVWDTLTNVLHVESDELLAQHTRYALIVTEGVRDAAGRRIRASDRFRDFRQTVRGGYKYALLAAVYVARHLGISERDIVTASVFTTQSITPVMERIRDHIKTDVPAPADFRLGPNGERTVFSHSELASISWRQHTTVSPPGFTTIGLDLTVLDVVPGAVAAVAYGTFVSPQYLVPGEYIPAVGTRNDIPAVQAYERISFTLYLPSGAKPTAGWPTAIIGVPNVRHAPMAALASTLASRGIATIGIHTAGCGFGPLGSLTVTRKDGSSVVVPDIGRSIDQNGDNSIAGTEGSVAAPPRAWAIGERDGYRQTAIDLMQLVRVLEVGMDVDGDGLWDVDAGRISHVGFSAGAMHGTMFLALEPSVSIAVENNAGGMAPEHGRWSPLRRPALGALLQARTPSLINSPGITAIDGVPVGPPHFNENKPLRNLQAVTNTVAGAMEIQRVFEIHEWGQQAGQTPIVWAPYLRTKPLHVGRKSVVYQFAKGDQQANNPGTTALLRAGDLVEWTVHYRHDLALAEDPTIPLKNPHQVLIMPTHPNATLRAVSRGMQNQIAAFLASGGVLIDHPEPARFFEVPVAEPLPETLNYIQ